MSYVLRQTEVHAALSPKRKFVERAVPFVLTASLLLRRAGVAPLRKRTLALRPKLKR